MSYKVVYLTGAPGTGKTSLAGALVGHLAEIDVFNYGGAMVRRLRETAGSLNEIDLSRLRGDTYGMVSASDVKAVDSELAAWISQYRSGKHLIIDTHQVALGPDGLCSLSFSKEQLALLFIDEIWVLAAPSQVVRSRLLSDSGGRIVPSEFMADYHSALQANLAMSYAFELKCCLRLFDASRPIDSLLSSAVHALNA